MAHETTITCDLCDQIVTWVVKVEFWNGDHPHNGSQMYKTADVCKKCIKRLPRIKITEEFDNMQTLMQKG